MISDWASFLFGVAAALLVCLILASVYRTMRRPFRQPPPPIEVAPGFLQSLVADGTCEWIALDAAESKKDQESYEYFPHPQKGSRCHLTQDGVTRVLMLRPALLARLTSGPTVADVFKELLQNARTGSVLRFTMLTVFLTVTGALVTAYSAAQPYFQVSVVALAGLLLSAAFLTLEIVLSYNLASLNEKARALAHPLHGDIFPHRHWLPLWSVRILAVSLISSIGLFWTFALVSPESIKADRKLHGSGAAAVPSEAGTAKSTQEEAEKNK